MFRLQKMNYWSALMSHPCSPMGSPVSTAVANLYIEFYEDLVLKQALGLVRCLYDRAKSNTNSQDTLVQEEHHITMVLKQNSYPDAFIRSSTQPQPIRDTNDREVKQKGNDMQRPPLVLLPYVSGVSKDIRWVSRGFG